MEKVIEAAKRARCHDFIMKLPQGYDTVIGESGGTLSGGERQRLSIARAMMKDAPIIILDEATANVDPENEQELMEAIDALTDPGGGQGADRPAGHPRGADGPERHLPPLHHRPSAGRKLEAQW